MDNLKKEEFINELKNKNKDIDNIMANIDEYDYGTAYLNLSNFQDDLNEFISNLSNFFNL